VPGTKKVGISIRNRSTPHAVTPAGEEDRDLNDGRNQDCCTEDDGKVCPRKMLSSY
jgi:hypothetical protein